MAMKRIRINLPDEVHESLKKMCNKECRNVSAQVQFLIKNAELKYDRENPAAGSELVGLTT